MELIHLKSIIRGQNECRPNKNHFQSKSLFSRNFVFLKIEAEKLNPKKITKIYINDRQISSIRRTYAFRFAEFLKLDVDIISNNFRYIFKKGKPKCVVSEIDKNISYDYFFDHGIETFRLILEEVDRDLIRDNQISAQIAMHQKYSMYKWDLSYDKNDRIERIKFYDKDNNWLRFDGKILYDKKNQVKSIEKLFPRKTFKSINSSNEPTHLTFGFD